MTDEKTISQDALKLFDAVVGQFRQELSDHVWDTDVAKIELGKVLASTHRMLEHFADRDLRHLFVESSYRRADIR